MENRKLLRTVGQKIRQLRSKLGLTAKKLAINSGVSIRFYHNLERGTANISILRLAAIANALGVSLSELLLENKPRHIALLGLRGAGKSTIGPKLAKYLKRKFIELDKEIEKSAGLPLTKIFTLHGEDYYRKLGTQCFEAILSRNEMTVVELPGGIVKDRNLYDHIRNNCTTVWLKARPADHMNRVYLQGDTRPMANRKNAMEELKQILEDREPLYKLADITVDTSLNTIPSTLALLQKDLATE